MSSKPNTTTAIEIPEAQREVGDKMVPALRKPANDVRRIVETTRRSSVQAIWQIGQIVAGVSADEARYGKAAVAQIGGFTGMSTQSLYEYATIWRTYPDWETLSPMLNRPLGRDGRGGAGLTSTHLLTASVLTNSKDRKAILERTIREGLTTRELAKAVSEKVAAQSAPAVKGGAAAKAEDADRVIRGTAKAFAEAVGKFRGSLSHLPVDFASRFKGIHSPTAEDLSMLDALVESLDEVWSDLTSRYTEVQLAAKECREYLDEKEKEEAEKNKTEGGEDHVTAAEGVLIDNPDADAPADVADEGDGEDAGDPTAAAEGDEEAPIEVADAPDEGGETPAEVEGEGDPAEETVAADPLSLLPADPEPVLPAAKPKAAAKAASKSAPKPKAGKGGKSKK